MFEVLETELSGTVIKVVGAGGEGGEGLVRLLDFGFVILCVVASAI